MFQDRSKWYVNSAYGGISGLVMIVAGLLATAALVAGIGVLAYNINRVQCSQKASALGVESHYRFISGCYYDLDNGVSIPAAQWRAFQHERVTH